MTNHHELERMIRESQQTTTPEFDHRILADASDLLSHDHRLTSTTTDGSATIPPHSHLWRRVVPSVTVLCGLALILVWWFSRPTDSWAQVVEAVRDKPWIHLVLKIPDGEKFEQWYSMPHQISASHAPSYTDFFDFRTGRSEYYSPEKGHITRFLADSKSSNRKNFEDFSLLFQELTKGEEQLSFADAFLDDPDIKSVEQSRREIKDQKGRWYEYELRFQQDEPQADSLTIRVDSESMLPQTMTMNISDEGEAKSMTFLFDFPDTGPQDIYALGVPRDKEIVDISPQQLTGRRKEIVDAIRAAAEGFDDYRALMISSKPDLPWHIGTPYLVWRQGNKSRSETGCIDPDNPPPKVEPGKQTDHLTWWKNRCRKLWFLSGQIFDGETLFDAQYVTPESEYRQQEHPYVFRPDEWVVTGWKEHSWTIEWPARTAPIVWAYPKSIEGMLESPLYEIEIVPEPRDDAPKAVRLKAVSTPEGENRTDESEYLLDPEKGYALLHSRTASFTLDGDDKVLSSEFEQTCNEWKQSPKGYWYPTLILSESSFLQDGEQIHQPSRVHYYLDFDVPMPDTLFGPREREGDLFSE